MIAVFGQVHSVRFEENKVDYFELNELSSIDLYTYEQVLINGLTDHQPAVLDYSVLDKLWKYVENGGMLYGEMINCDDFPSSRLFGFKQDFPLTYRRLEKLRVTDHLTSLQTGQLFEMNGPFLTGFSFDSKVYVDMGLFTETHVTESEGQFPVIIGHSLGRGKTIFSTVPIIGNQEPWTLRPNWVWDCILNNLSVESGLAKMERIKVIDSEPKSTEETIHRGVRWFFDSGIMPKVDGSLGIYENIHAFRGTVSQDIRPDCNAQSALMFYLYGEYSGNDRYKDTSHNILKYLLESGYQDLDPESLTYGFWKWFKFPSDKPDQMFTDDNSWVALVLLYLYRKTGHSDYKRRGLLTIEAMYRTQNHLGLRVEAIRRHELLEHGANHFKESNECSMNPHFESIAHAAYLQAYLVTKDQTYLDVASKGTRHLLENMDQLKFMYSKTSGFSRFLLALSEVYQLTNYDVFLKGIQEVVDYLRTHQHELGGIEEADNPDPDRYGKEDTGVFRFNNEGIGDQLYTNNFLLLNSFEAYRSTGNQEYLEFHKRIKAFIQQIQITSERDVFHGGWMRAYHLQQQEYFGNNGDTGWGAYCIESGWTNALTIAGLIMSEQHVTFLD
ncbi:hypothetical protein [Aquisalibacillus elongatus]|uniref:Uncharacterized protein n=1 Tax=Aquisalibacillus elongatus TaxID=485577 RepID=A0A3N5BWY9_9BACI|nr:hypothetical protein [Aquisalibacillus elongatus]RPF54268.1 hypothetical protein EDC24_1465 [Aquisalibacillus elongatus]